MILLIKPRVGCRDLYNYITVASLNHATLGLAKSIVTLSTVLLDSKGSKLAKANRATSGNQLLRSNFELFHIHHSHYFSCETGRRTAPKFQIVIRLSSQGSKSFFSSSIIGL